MKYILTIFILLLISSCGTTVGYDFDTEKNFSKYTTFDFYSPLSSGLNELDEKRIIRITDSLLTLKGMQRSENPQLLINFYSSEYISNSRNTIGIGMGGGGRNTSVGISGGIPIGGKEVNQQLTIDFIDAELDALVWQAKAQGHFKENAKPEQKQNYYNQTLTKVFKKYPPKQN